MEAAYQYCLQAHFLFLRQLPGSKTMPSTARKKSTTSKVVPRVPTTSAAAGLAATIRPYEPPLKPPPPLPMHREGSVATGSPHWRSTQTELPRAQHPPIWRPSRDIHPTNSGPPLFTTANSRIDKTSLTQECVHTLGRNASTSQPVPTFARNAAAPR